MDSPFYRRGFAVAALLLVGYLLFRVLEPFLGPMVWAAFLAFMLYPLHERWTRCFKGRATMSAALITVLTPVAILIPLAVIGGVFAAQAAELAGRARGFVQGLGVGGLTQFEQYPVVGPVLLWVDEHTGFGAQELRDWLLSSGESFLKWGATIGGNVVVGALGTVLAFAIAIVLLYFFLCDGAAWIRRGVRLIPMQPERRDGLVDHLAQVTRAVVFGSGITALLQGAAVGVGFAIAGLSSFVVFGVL